MVPNKEAYGAKKESIRCRTKEHTAGLNKTISFHHPKIWNVSWKCIHFYCMNLWQKEQNLIISATKINNNIFCFCDMIFFLWQKLFFVTETFICERIFFLWQKFFQWHNLFCDRILFMWPKLIFLTETSFSYRNFYLWQKLFSLKESCF